MTQTNLSALIDAFAELKAKTAALEVEEKNLKAALADVPAGAYESELHRLTISERTDSKPDDELKAEIAKVTKAAVEAYRATLSRQYLTAHTIESQVRTHKIGARNGKGLS